MQATYHIVDMVGDNISPDLIKPGRTIPVEIKAVEVTANGTVVFTLEYQHDKNGS